MNSANYCDHVFEQGLLLDIRRLSNDDFLFQQDRAPAHWLHHTAAYLHFCVPEFISSK